MSEVFCNKRFAEGKACLLPPKHSGPCGWSEEPAPPAPPPPAAPRQLEHTRLACLQAYLGHHPYCKAITVQDSKACVCGLSRLVNDWFAELRDVDELARAESELEEARVEALEKALEEGIQIANNAATSGRNGWQLGAADRRLAEAFVEAARKLLEGKR